jgi:anti-repressor protein
MKELKIFENDAFGSVRTIIKNTEPWFVAKDIAEVLGYSATDKMTRRLDPDEKADHPIQVTSNETRRLRVINESGLYNAIFGSTLKKAKAFKKWITSEVLPAIRKTGGYLIEKEEDTPEEIMARALLVAQNTLKRREERILALEDTIETQKPLVEFAEHVTDSSDAISIGDFAKVLNDENINIGRSRLFSYLRENNYLMKDNMPYQKYIDSGYFKVIEQAFKTPYRAVVSFKTLLTAKGQIYFVEKFRRIF